MPRVKTLLPLLLAMGLLVSSGRAETPEPAPEPIFVDISGRTVRVSEHLGYVVLLNFWATWCGPCRTEMPEIQKLHEALSPQGLRVIAPAANGRDEGPQVTRVLAERGATYESWLWVSAKDMRYWGVGPGLPATVLLDREGRVRHRFQGMVTDAQLRPLLTEMLAEKPAPAPAR